MKKSNLIIQIILFSLVIVAVTGVFEEQALAFVTGVSKKNLDFMGLLAEVKLVLSSVSSVHVPFLSGEMEEVNRSLDNVQKYLFSVNIISVLQVMLLTISKSLMIKIGMVVLFFLSLLKTSKIISTKLLIIVLALNPGLVIYSVFVQQLSKEASIDFGDGYQKELKVTISKIQMEKSQLMQEHAKNLTQIDNGERGIDFFKKLREDISYDIRKTKVDIKGDYTQIRLLLKDGGHTMIRKTFLFCTTILFCLFILPVGYSLLIYILYKSLYKKSLPNTIESDVNRVASEINQEKKTLLNRIASATKAARNEFKNSNLIQEIKTEIKDHEYNLGLKSKIENVLTHEKDSMISLSDKVLSKAEKLGEDTISNIHVNDGVEDEVKNDVENVLHTTNSLLKNSEEKIEENLNLEIKSKIENVLTHEKDSVISLGNKVLSKTEKLNDDIHLNDGVKNEVKSDVENVLHTTNSLFKSDEKKLNIDNLHKNIETVRNNLWGEIKKPIIKI